jgi:hypothetical protein
MFVSDQPSFREPANRALVQLCKTSFPVPSRQFRARPRPRPARRRTGKKRKKEKQKEKKKEKRRKAEKSATGLQTPDRKTAQSLPQFPRFLGFALGFCRHFASPARARTTGESQGLDLSCPED